MRRLAQIIAGIVLAGILISGGSPAAAETSPPKETPAAEKKAEQTLPGKAKTKIKGKKQKRAASQCDLSRIERIDILPGGKIVGGMAPIPEDFSGKCYCQAAEKKYVFPNPRGGAISGIFVMSDRAFRCFHAEAPPGELTKEIRMRILKDDFENDDANHLDPIFPKTTDK